MTSDRWIRVGLIAICIFAIALCFTLWSWTFTTSRLNSARSIGIFSSPSEGMLSIVHSGWTGIQEVKIVHAEQETAFGGGPHVWYVVACVFADPRADDSPVGASTHNFDSPGSYFVNTKDGWVLMPEASLPLFVGFWMRIFSLAGEGDGQVIDEPCIRTAGIEPTPGVTPTPFTGAVRPVIIDTDMAADDWMAILYLLNRPDVSVEAITVTGTGEAHCEPGIKNAMNLAALAGQPAIPVSCGRTTPLQGDHAFPQEWRTMVDTLAGLTLPANPASGSPQTAVELLTAKINSMPGKVTILALGPLTNLAEALQSAPEIKENIEMLYIMGGAVDVPGNVGFSNAGIDNMVADWNIYVDPRAAAIVLQSGVPVTLVPLDATNQVPVTLKFINRLKNARKTPEARFVFDVLSKTQYSDFVRFGRYYFWDTLAAAILTDPSLANFETRNLIVIEEEGNQSGRTQSSEIGAPVRMAVEVEAERFEQMFLDTLNSYPFYRQL